MKNLYIMRHGMAEAYHLRPDADRRLVAEGEVEVRNVAKQWQADTPSLSTIIASPYRRAQQTALIVGEVLEYRDKPVTSSNFTPDSPVPVAVKDLEACEGENILLVSHMPLVGKLVGFLCSGDSQSIGGLATAQIVRLYGEVITPGCMEVETIYYPA